MKSLTLPCVFLASLAAYGHAAPLHAGPIAKGGFLRADLSSNATIALLALEDSQVFEPAEHIPMALQYFFAGLWICMLGSLPFVMPFVDKKGASKTQIGLGVAMLSVLLGGIYLFTNIILFQSVHFKEVRPLTLVECIYFMAQVITTVGYGDIVPAKPRGQVFVGLYVLGALTVITMLVSDVTDHILKVVQTYKDQRGYTPRDDRVKDLKSLLIPEKPPITPLLTSLACFAVIDIIWIAFFSLHPGENKTVFQAAYMSVITLSTVGLGYFTPLTEEGMVFGAFFMLLGATALVSVIGNFTELMVKMNLYERFKEESKIEAVANLRMMVKHGKDGTKTPHVGELEFLKFALLQMNALKQKDLDAIQRAFINMKPEKGVVSLQKIQQSLKDSVKTDAIDLNELAAGFK